MTLPRAPTPDHPPCIICGGSVTRHKMEAVPKYRKRRACSRICGNKWLGVVQRKDRPTGAKSCVICEGEFTIRDNEPVHHFQRRQTCGGDTCVRKLQSEKAARQPKVELTPPWPRARGEIIADFSLFNEDPNDTRGTIPLRPATLIMKQSSVA